MTQDIRWIQRFENYSKALKQLEKAVNLYRERELSDLEKQGFIQAFEFTFELAWNLLRDYLTFQGLQDIYGSRDAIKTAFKYNLIENGEVWMQMLLARNLTLHTYNENFVDTLIKEIASAYIEEFSNLYSKFIIIKDTQ